MKIREIRSKSVLSASKVFDYVVNPYVGCQHACTYCYARFMRRFSGHPEPWGDFVDIKINAPDLLRGEIRKKRKGRVWVSGVCDPYQPLESRFRLSRKCLEILLRDGWPVIVQTRSPLVLRDLDLFRESADLEAGLSITTSEDGVRKRFEPHAPSIPERLRAVETLHRHGIRTYAMIAPILPGSEKLVGMLEGKVDYILFDRMNYHYADRIYARYGWNSQKSDAYFKRTGDTIAEECGKRGIRCLATDSASGTDS